MYCRQRITAVHPLLLRRLPLIPESLLVVFLYRYCYIEANVKSDICQIKMDTLQTKMDAFKVERDPFQTKVDTLLSKHDTFKIQLSFN